MILVWVGVCLGRPPLHVTRQRSSSVVRNLRRLRSCCSASWVFRVAFWKNRAFLALMRQTRCPCVYVFVFVLARVADSALASGIVSQGMRAAWHCITNITQFQV